MSSQESSSPASKPPAVDLRLPPSPPQSPKRRSPPALSPVDRILGLLHLLHAGQLPHSRRSRSFRLSQDDFAALNRRIEADAALAAFYTNKVRWEYQEGVYLLRMPSAVHEIFTARAVDGIAEAIHALATRLGGTAGNALRGIKKGGSPTLKLSGPAPPSSSSQESQEEVLVETHRSPDGTFFHDSTPEWPGVVLEVSYSQRDHKLDRIAESYIVDSFGGIRCVVGLELPYGRDPRVKSCNMGIDCTAAVSIWRPKVDKDEAGEETLTCACEVEHVPFSGRAGQKMDGQLELGMADLLPAEVLDTLDDEMRDQRIIVPFADLWTYLKDANDAERALQAQKTRPATRAGMKRRKRKRTPEEEMDAEREGKFQRLEDAAVEREQRQDSAWRRGRSGSSAREPERRSARLSLRASRSRPAGD